MEPPFSRALLIYDYDVSGPSKWDNFKILVGLLTGSIFDGAHLVNTACNACSLFFPQRAAATDSGCEAGHRPGGRQGRAEAARARRQVNLRNLLLRRRRPRQQHPLQVREAVYEQGLRRGRCPRRAEGGRRQPRGRPACRRAAAGAAEGHPGDELDATAADAAAASHSWPGRPLRFDSSYVRVKRAMDR